MVAVIVEGKHHGSIQCVPQSSLTGTENCENRDDLMAVIYARLFDSLEDFFQDFC